MPTVYRYAETATARGGLSTATSARNIRVAMTRGDLSYKEHVLKEGERLDIIAHQEYGDGRMWWVIAAASNIGWWPQLPPGTLLKIPTNILEISQVI